MLAGVEVWKRLRGSKEFVVRMKMEKFIIQLIVVIIIDNIITINPLH